MASFHKSLCIFFGFFITLICFSDANTFNVGGKDGWTLHPSESYSQWSSRLRFVVNDILHFKYNGGTDSVLEVSKGDYDSCNTNSPITTLTGGDSTFSLKRPGPFYFISGNKSNCDQGQKLTVVVITPRSTKTPPAVAPTPPGSPPGGPGGKPGGGGSTSPPGAPGGSPGGGGGSTSPPGAPGASPGGGGGSSSPSGSPMGSPGGGGGSTSPTGSPMGSPGGGGSSSPMGSPAASPMGNPADTPSGAASSPNGNQGGSAERPTVSAILSVLVAVIIMFSLAISIDD
ncbi:hypothetical protein M8C21_017687 [Ambrosia artemisiifolia]|uniref:Phytocyanin domain-containing protein n=1 Tax=Ambrosia artemisiifolia TaxID=4212 RepID=A0AAD5D117_AMBAR|nr:hypothetical protein M8C21_017687 [Ambrosia artemisiifolia]